MLEFLVFAFLSQDSQHLWQRMEQVQQTLPGIEVLPLAPVPTKPIEKIAPQFIENPSLAVLAYDLGTGKILYQKEVTRSQPIASLTKILSYLVIREENNLNAIVKVPREAILVNGAKVGIHEQEQLTVQTLLEASLIPSANDAMLTLAIYNAGSEEAFVKKMQAMAQKIGLPSAEIYNATGLDVLDKKTGIAHGNKMSAIDILRLTRIALKDDFFRETVAQKQFVGTSIDGRYAHEMHSTNQLLGTFVNSQGVKTGYTELAGECLVNLSRNAQEQDILTVILGSRDRFGETKNLVGWVMDSYVWR